LLRLGFDAKRAFHNRTGLGNYARTFLSNLVQFFPENEYHLFTPASGYPASNLFLENALSASSFHLHQDKTTLASWNRSFRMRGPLLANQIQLYHGLSNEVPMDLKRLQGRVRSVVTVHDLIFMELPDTYPLVDRWIYQFKTRHTLAIADCIVAISESTRHQLLRYYPEHAHKIKVILQPCSPHFYEESVSASVHPLGKQAYWLSVGTVEKRKNLEAVLHALHQTKPSERLPLVVIGNTDSPYAAHCMSLAAQRGLQVHWNPHKPPLGEPDLKIWYRHAVGLVYPSHLEGFGLPVAEALLSRCPVITLRNSAMAEICGPHSLLVDSALDEELQSAMSTLQRDSTLRAQLQRDGFHRVKTLLDPEKLTTQWIDFYRDLIGHGNPKTL